MAEKVISAAAVERREYWVAEIAKLSGNFGDDSARLQKELEEEFARDGHTALRDHLRLCGAIPEWYGHDSTEEKLYSKYTDILLALAFASYGITSLVLEERGDSADVACESPECSFVADAKAFRLSRTAKNQKDFKVQAMDGWKQGRAHAALVSPTYQLPARASQIYQQAAARNVCLLTYSHLAYLSAVAEQGDPGIARTALYELFRTVEALNPSKDAVSYWQAVNRAMLRTTAGFESLWALEKVAAAEAIEIGKFESLTYLSKMRAKMMLLSREEAVKELLRLYRVESRVDTIASIANSKILDIE